MTRVRTIAVLRRAFALAERERKFMLSELTQVKGLMPLLMKPRNKQEWSPQDRAQLRAHFKRLSGLSPYFVALVMPGGFVVLPALTWWLDRRRGRRALPAKSA
ncbi:MAG: hypothetical protein A2Z64_03805 [Betaproteobacteria bacterium RIFCSPLOWO2_02_67_12]|nr:MAG: hypothetical protein A2Z64_03805 [Betaproteobacteria bacterium RIFCSPLOWO2_02_67_12]